MNYLDYLQQYRKKYHLDDIFIPNDNVEEEQIKLYIENLCNVYFYHLEKFLEHPEKGSDYYNHRIGVYVLKNSVLKNTRKEPKDLDYLTRFLVTTLDQPDSLILDSIAKENNPVINKNVSRHKNTSSDTLLYLASYSFLGIDILHNKNSNDEVLLEVTNTLLRDLSDKIYWELLPDDEDWEFVQDLVSYIKEYQPAMHFFEHKTLDKILMVVQHLKISESISNKIMSVDLETLKTLEWYHIFYHLGRNPFTPEIILELLSEREPVGPYKPSCLIGVLENPNTPKHILEKHLDCYPHIKQWREINFGE